MSWLKRESKTVVETAKSEKSEKSSLLEEVTSLEREEVKKTRVVKLRLVVGCGCGGDYNKITREVPYESDLKDGDYVYESDPSDKTGW